MQVFGLFRRIVRTRFLAPLAGLAMSTALSVFTSIASAQEQAPFDKQPYKFDGGLDTPMLTIAGLTEWARDINHVYGLVTWITGFIFFAVAIPLVYTIYRFKAKPGDDTPPKQFHGNHTLEILWTVIPVILLIFIAVPTWRVIFRHSARAEGKVMQVQVIGHQWWWEFRYPELGITTANELHLPENTAIDFELTSADVIHSFWVPKFGGKVDALPGVKNHMYVTMPPLANPDAKGGEYYQGQCVELCGASHALMRFSLVLHSEDEFNRWAASHKEPPKTETSSERAGEQIFARCVACHTIAGTPSEQIPGEKIGPDLTDFGNRKYLGAGTRLNNAANLADWIRNPADIKPGALMPPLGLTEQEIQQVSSYLRYSTAKNY
jgi:cytochrome c oxidase subunit 2